MSYDLIFVTVSVERAFFIMIHLQAVDLIFIHIHAAVILFIILIPGIIDASVTIHHFVRSAIPRALK